MNERSETMKSQIRSLIETIRDSCNCEHEKEHGFHRLPCEHEAEVDDLLTRPKAVFEHLEAKYSAK